MKKITFKVSFQPSNKRENKQNKNAACKSQKHK